MPDTRNHANSYYYGVSPRRRASSICLKQRKIMLKISQKLFQSNGQRNLILSPEQSDSSRFEIIKHAFIE